jgi:hypothetical protein
VETVIILTAEATVVVVVVVVVAAVVVTGIIHTETRPLRLLARPRKEQPEHRELEPQPTTVRSMHSTTDPTRTLPTVGIRTMWPTTSTTSSTPSSNSSNHNRSRSHKALLLRRHLRLARRRLRLLARDLLPLHPVAATVLYVLLDYPKSA